jgi:hypothetical protein
MTGGRYLTPSDLMALTDWQSATIGHWSRDYAYAVTTALTIENPASGNKNCCACI